jgi:glutathione S-transferase
MAEYQLHCFGESGNSYRVALMLELTGSDWEPVFVDYFNGETRGSDYREMSVMGEAPVLARGDLRLTQSGVILDYLADETGRFGGATPEEKREIWRWVLFDNHKLSSFTAIRRFLLTLTKAGESPVTDFLAQRMDGAWSVLESHLKDRAFVVAERPTVADISLCGYLFYSDELVWPLERYPAISAWLERIRALPGWKPPYELMPRALPVSAR